MTRRRWRLAVCLAFAAIVAGCAGPASRDGMTVTGMATTKKSPSTVSVRVSGGTDGIGPNVADADLKAAIEASIRDSGLFRAVTASNADYDLSVFITRLDRPSFGLSFTVEMEAGWTLTRVADKAVLLRRVVTSSGTATFSDAAVGATRIRLAVEGAARNNVAEGLRAIGAVDPR